jgi:arginine N-succinyltransferase
VLGDLAPGKEAGAVLSQAARAALGVREGDAVRCVPLHQPQDEQSGEAQ